MWFIPFIIGILIAQETELPKIRPYLTLIFQKIVLFIESYNENK